MRLKTGIETAGNVFISITLTKTRLFSLLFILNSHRHIYNLRSFTTQYTAFQTVKG